MQDVILFLKNMKKITKYYENDIENHVTYSFNLNDKKIDYIPALIEDLKIYAFHGVLPEETLVGNYFIINLEILADIWKAAKNDNLNDTVNYADINEIIHEEMKIPSKLLENVAWRIIKRIHENFLQVENIKIKITKNKPPMQGEMQGVSVELEKSFV